MKRASCAYFLILLLSSAMLDDACVSGTAGGPDDILAAGNNEYPPSASPEQTKPSAERDLPLPGSPSAEDGRPDAARLARGTPAGADAAARPGPTLLYLFMSLQR